MNPNELVHSIFLAETYRNNSNNNSLINNEIKKIEL